MQNSIQVNFRIPLDLKERAWKKAEQLGTDPSSLMRLFWTQFVEKDDVVQIRQTVDMEKIFDAGIASYFMSAQGKKKTQKIEALLKNV